jgi:peptidoglycan/xylan/chitin deacetylase (PgdA/CDA1 family)
MKSQAQARRRLGTAIVCVAAATAVGISCALPVDESEEDIDLGWTSEPLSRSTNPPGGLTPSQVPQFVSITFDDNFAGEGMTWAVDTFAPLRNPVGSGNGATFDSTPVRGSFYHNCVYLDGQRSAWQRAANDGHETGNHTSDHLDGLNFTTQQWANQIDPCRTRLMSELGLTAQQVSGFRAPFLRYNDALFTVLESRSPAYAYDTSIPSCLGSTEDGTNCAWPYTLEVPSVDAANRKALNPIFQDVNAHPGFWEMPNPVVIVPADQRAGIPAEQFIGGSSTGKILGMDISMFFDAKMNKAQSLAALKNTLDLHLNGNRAPLIFVGHTHVYASSWDGNVPQISLADRRAVITEFIQYALTKPAVRIRPVVDILTWMKNPVALGGPSDPERTEGGTVTTSGGNSCNSTTETPAKAYDNTTSTKWCALAVPSTSAPLSTVYDFAGTNAYVITRYKVSTANDQAPRDPKNWTLQGCNGACTAGSDSGWVTLDTRTNQFAGAARFQTNTYTISSTTAYQQVRLRITANSGSTNITQLSEIELFGAPGVICTPTTCSAQGKNCGTISDGCGGTLTCGSCTSPQTCGGGGVANVCGGGSSSCSPTVSSYTQARCNSTAVYNGNLYRCISQAATVNGEPSGCGTAGVYCSSIEPTNAAWGTTAWTLVQSCP